MAAKKKTGVFDVSKLVGLTEEDAKTKITAAGLKCRVRNRDGQAFVGTCDYRMDRVNLSITDGKVTSASLG